MPNERVVRFVPTACVAAAAQKLGQPVPLSNFVFEENRSSVAAGAGERAAALLVQQRARERALGPGLAQHRVLIGRQQLAPLGVAVRHLEALRRARRRGRTPAVKRHDEAPCSRSHQRASSAQHQRVLVNASQFGAPITYVTVRGAATEIAGRHRELIAPSPSSNAQKSHDPGALGKRSD